MNAPDRSAESAAPSGIWDCHIHIIGPTSQYPLVPDRSYTPPEASVQDYLRVASALEIEHAVVVQPSFYGTDNRCTRDALLASNGKWRGVAVVTPGVSEPELAELHAAGFRGARINLLFKGGVGMDALEEIAQRIQPLRWHVQLLVDGRHLAELAPRLRKLPVACVVDHMGHMPAAAGVDHPGFQALLQLLREGCWVKLSGPYRISQQPDFADVVPLARALVEAAPARVVWGTDWPHVAVNAAVPRPRELMELLSVWVPDPEIRRRVLVENPKQLYA